MDKEHRARQFCDARETALIAVFGGVAVRKSARKTSQLVDPVNLPASTMLVYGAGRFWRAKSALQNPLLCKTPCLSLRLRLRASRAKARTTSGQNPDRPRMSSAIVRLPSCCCPGLIRLMSDSSLTKIFQER